MSFTLDQLPKNTTITRAQQFRKCGKPSCTTCQNGAGHGPYWYVYWREGKKLHSGYVGKEMSDEIRNLPPSHKKPGRPRRAPVTVTP